MRALTDWVDHRTGLRGFVHEALYESVPGGARWRYVWGSTLVFVFVVQLITGLFLWMSYSPSAQTAWESVYYIQYEMEGGSLLRGIHHYAAQLMVVLLALHFMQVVIDGAYRAPREINFWLGLLLLIVTLGLALTGYLLPWDQKGYWATQVATRIASLTPVIGPSLQQFIVGGGEYGHHTVTRFFALHAGLLPAAMVVLIAIHVALFRRHGLTAKQPHKGPETTFWPDQVLRDAIACLAVLATIIGLAIWEPAELGAPADPSETYAAARPEWYFLFLFQFLKYFEGTSERLGAIYIPGLLMLALFLMPVIGRWKVGHWFNVAFLLVVLVGAGWLTFEAVYDDRHAAWVDGAAFASAEEALLGEDAEAVKAAIAAEIDTQGEESKYASLDPIAQFEAYYADQPPPARKAFEERLAKWQAFRTSEDFLHAVEMAEIDAHRAHELAAEGIPPTGALALLQSDPQTQGRKLFAANCASCHPHTPPEGVLRPEFTVVADSISAANLYGFASREWIKGLFDPERVASHEYFGNTEFAEGEMVDFVQTTFDTTDLDEEEKKELIQQVEEAVAAMSAEAELPYQAEKDAADKEMIAAGRTHLTETFECTMCHLLGDEGETEAPDLTGYGSRQWLLDFLSNPADERFYGDDNDRMPAFAAHPDDPSKNLLSQEQLEMIVDFMRAQGG